MFKRFSWLTALGLLLFMFFMGLPGLKAEAAEKDFTIVLQDKGTIKSLHLSSNVAEDGLAFAVIEEEYRRNNHALYRSKDAGCTWEPLPFKIDGTLELRHNALIYDLEIGDKNTVYLSALIREGKPALYISRDAGTSWETVCKEGPEAFELLDEREMIGVFRQISGVSSMLKWSKDAGATWTKDIGLNIATGAGALRALNKQTFLALKTDERLWYTADAGKNWRETEVKIPKYLSLGHSGTITGRVDALNNLTAAVCGPGKSPYLYVSPDSRFNWQSLNLAEQAVEARAPIPYVNTVCLVPEEHLLVATNQREILMSPDYGTTWEVLTRGFQSEVKHLQGAALKGPEPTLILAASDTQVYRMAYQENGISEPTGPGSGPAPSGPSSMPDALKFFVGQNNYLKNGNNILMDAQPFIAGDHVYVPFRYLAAALDVPENRMVWYPISRTVIMTKNEIRLHLFVGEDVIYINDLPTCMYAKSLLKNDRVYLPARYVAEAFGYQVAWDPVAQSVTVWPQ